MKMIDWPFPPMLWSFCLGLQFLKKQLSRSRLGAVESMQIAAFQSNMGIARNMDTKKIILQSSYEDTSLVSKNGPWLLLLENIPAFSPYKSTNDWSGGPHFSLMYACPEFRDRNYLDTDRRLFLPTFSPLSVYWRLMESHLTRLINFFPLFIACF
jgi:hypothetical protein